MRAAAARDLAHAGEGDAPIEIVEYDPMWAIRFESERFGDDREAYSEAKSAFIRGWAQP